MGAPTTSLHATSPNTRNGAILKRLAKLIDSNLRASSDRSPFATAQRSSSQERQPSQDGKLEAERAEERGPAPVGDVAVAEAHHEARRGEGQRRVEPQAHRAPEGARDAD